MAGSAAYQRVDRPYSLLAQNEGSVTDQTEKAFVFRAETEISWSPFPTKAGAPVGTRLHRPLCNILKSHCNFKSLPTDRKPGHGRGCVALLKAGRLPPAAQGGRYLALKFDR